jgi:hypothetical protein
MQNAAVTLHICFWYIPGLQTMRDLRKPVHVEHPLARASVRMDCPRLGLECKQQSKKQPLAATLLHLTSSSSLSCTCACITHHFSSLTDTAPSASAILLQCTSLG